MIHQYNNTAPAATLEQVSKYGATCSGCGCPDKTNRGGSHSFGSLKVCKHQAYQLARAFEIFEELETDKSQYSSLGFCGCMGFIKSGFRTCSHIELLNKILWAMSEAEQAQKPVKKEISQAEAEALFARFD